jgi:MFS family permease
MQILEDDHLLSIGLMLIILSTAICSVPWGILADKKGSVTAIICFLIVDFFSKIFAAFVSNKVWYLISMVLIGATEKTMMVIFGPILVDTYGLKIATELLPLKGVSVIISMIIAACLGLVLSQYAEKSLYWLCGFNVIGVIIGVYLAIVISKHHKINKKIKYPEDGISV